MKRKNILLASLVVFSSLFAIQSCKEDEPSIAVKQAFTTPVAVAPVPDKDGIVHFTNGTQIALQWKSENSGGDAASWTVYFGTGSTPAKFRSDVTKDSIHVSIVDGQTYYWRVETVDSRGTVTTSPVNKFIAVSGISPRMSIDLTCATDVKTAIGVDLPADDVIDLRLLIIDAVPDTIEVAVDGAKSAESYKGIDTLADGKYRVAVDIFSTKNFGDINTPLKIDLTLKLAQLGLIDETFEFAQVMTNEFVCEGFRVYLADITKTGSKYVVEKNLVKPTSEYSGPWGGKEMDFYPKKDLVNVPYESQIEVYVGCDLMIKNLGLGWMNDFWGEVVIAGGSAVIGIDATAGTVTIAKQNYMITTYEGAVQPTYKIQGSGTIDLTGAKPKMVINYDLLQGTSNWATWCQTRGYIKTPNFVATIELDAATAKAIKQKMAASKVSSEVELAKK